MASAAIIQIEDLIKPISEENPVGDDIRQDSSPASLFYSIKDARNAARAAERNNMFDSNSSEADDQWRKILQIAPEILQQHAKDLEIASWYTEALLRHYGFQGLRDGFKLILQLVQFYWDKLYPLPDEDGIETRVASLSGLNGEGTEGVLIAPIRNINLTQGSEPGPFNFWKYQQALDIEKIIDEELKSNKASRLGFTLQDIEQAVSESSENFFIDLKDDISETITTFQQLSSTLDENCGIHDAPPTSNIISILEECLGTVKHIGKYKLPAHEDSHTDDEMTTENSAQSTTDSAPQMTGPIKDRQDAFRKLTEISAFFRKTEPHSPISYILERAVKWGDMPLEDLMKELIPDSSARDVYGSLTGVKLEDDY